MNIEKKVSFLAKDKPDMYETNIKNRLVEENVYRSMDACAEATKIPLFKSAKGNLPGVGQNKVLTEPE